MAVTAQGSGTKTAALGTFTVTVASPAVFTYNSHGLTAGDKVVLSTTGALPTGLTAGTTYFVISAGLTSNAFEVSTTDGGSAVTTTGTQSGTHSLFSEETLLDVAVAGSFLLEVDLVNLAAADAVVLRIYAIVLTGGTRRVVYIGTYQDAQPVDGVISASVPVSNELTDAGSLRFTLSQTFGTARAFPWKVLKVG